MWQHGCCHCTIRAEQRIASCGKNRCVTRTALLWIVYDHLPLVGIDTNPDTRVANIESIVTRTRRHLHQHLPLLFCVSHTSIQLRGFSMTIRQCQRKREIDQCVFTSAETVSLFSLDLARFAVTKNPWAAHSPHMVRISSIVRSLYSGRSVNAAARRASRCEHAGQSGI